MYKKEKTKHSIKKKQLIDIWWETIQPLNSFSAKVNLFLLFISWLLFQIQWSLVADGDFRLVIGDLKSLHGG